MTLDTRKLSPLAAPLLYLGIAALITYPLVLRLGDTFAGFPYGDAYENARHMWWMTHALRTGQPIFFQSLLAYPDGIAGLTLQATPLLLFPGWLFAFVLPLPAAYNLQLLLTLALNGWAMYGFTRVLTGRRDAALLAGIVFMSYPTLQGHLGASHLNILAQWGVPLYAWGLWRLTRIGDTRHTDAPWRIPTTVLVALAFVAVAWAHTIQVIYTLLPITAFFIVRALLRKDMRAVRRLILASGTGAALTLLWLLPVFGDAFGGAYASDGGSVRYSADLLAAITPSFFHPLWGSLPHTRAVLGINLDEGAGYIGLIAGGLALLGIWRSREARPWLALAIATYILALGPLLKWNDQPIQFITDGALGTIALPWALLEQLPGFDLARTPGRFNLTTGFAIAVMAAFGAAWLLARVRRDAARWALVAACAGLILFDYQTFFPLPTTRADIPRPIHELRQRGDVRAVFDIPWDNLLAAKDALYMQTAHQLPLIAGQVTRRTPVDPARLTLLETSLDPALLDAAGADIIIVHKSYVDDAERARLVAALGEPFYEDDRYALFEPPAVVSPRVFTAVTSDEAETTYFYAADAGWVMVDAVLTGGSGDATFALNGERLWTGTTVGDLSLRLPLALPAGYSTLRTTYEPPCPAQLPSGLRCDTPTLTIGLSDFTPGTGQTAAFGEGIRLNASRVMVSGAEVEAWLLWSLDPAPAPTDIRYIHLLDASGQIVAQVDSGLGAPSPGSWAEVITLPLAEDLPPGSYRIVVGWYRLPDVMPIGESVEIGRVESLAN